MIGLESVSRDVVECHAEGGVPEALLELGLIYASGREVEQNYVAAHKWFNLAALRGCDEAKHYRLELSREMSKSEIAQAQKLAREWIARH